METDDQKNKIPEGHLSYVDGEKIDFEDLSKRVLLICQARIIKYRAISVDACDIAQDVCVKFFRKVSSGELKIKKSSVHSWFATSIERKFLDELKKEKRYKQLISEYLDYQKQIVSEEDFSYNEEISQYIDKLSDKEKIVVRGYLNGDSYESIVMNLKKNNLKIIKPKTVENIRGRLKYRLKYFIKRSQSDDRN